MIRITKILTTLTIVVTTPIGTETNIILVTDTTRTQIVNKIITVILIEITVATNMDKRTLLVIIEANQVEGVTISGLVSPRKHINFFLFYLGFHKAIKLLQNIYLLLILIV